MGEEGFVLLKYVLYFLHFFNFGRWLTKATEKLKI